jgi:hypothetical protein
MASVEVEYERWAYSEGWSAGLLDGRRQGFEEGYGAGFDAGAEIGAARVLFEVEQAMAGQLLDLLPRLPHGQGYASFRDRTAASDQPCSYGCRACSRCIRAAAVAANTAQHGSLDYPGALTVRKGRS